MEAASLPSIKIRKMKAQEANENVNFLPKKQGSVHLVSLIVISLFYTRSQFPFNPLRSSTVSCAGALQSLLLRHHCSQQLGPTTKPSVDSAESGCTKKNT
jgi:hypothetical protein